MMKIVHAYLDNDIFVVKNSITFQNSKDQTRTSIIIIISSSSSNITFE